MIDFKTHKGMLTWEPQRGETIVSRILTRVTKKSQTRIGVIFDSEAENRDKTY